MLFRLWDCLDTDSQMFLCETQFARYRRLPKVQILSGDKMSQNDPATPAIMAALPEDVTHNRGVFKT